MVSPRQSGLHGQRGSQWSLPGAGASARFFFAFFGAKSLHKKENSRHPLYFSSISTAEIHEEGWVNSSARFAFGYILLRPLAAKLGAGGRGQLGRRLRFRGQLCQQVLRLYL